MSRYDFDLFVIGAGSGGVRGARIAASLGAKVAICEERFYGGTCVNVGCVPKKLFVYGAHHAEDFVDAAGFGWTMSNPQFDWPTLIRNKDREISRLNGIYKRILDNWDVKRVEGRGVLIDPHTVEVAGQRYTAKYILIATGGRPYRPSFPGSEHVRISDDMFTLPDLPPRVLVLGGGYIGVEFAGIFSGFGATTHLAHRGEALLRGFDHEVRHHLGEEMARHGVNLHFNRNTRRIDPVGDAYRVDLGDDLTLEVDLVLCACGRLPNSANLGLEAVGIETDEDGAIVVDDFSVTNVPSVYAVGDVTNRLQLTPVALAEGMAVARNLFGGQNQTVDYHNIPTTVFSYPNVGTVGLTEEDARDRYGDITVYTSRFTPMKHTMTGRHTKTFMKLIVDDASDRVVGCHMVGADAGEIIQGLAIALKCGATKAQFDSTIGIHPTAAEEFVTMRTPRAD